MTTQVILWLIDICLKSTHFKCGIIYYFFSRRYYLFLLKKEVFEKKKRICEVPSMRISSPSQSERHWKANRVFCKTWSLLALLTKSYESNGNIQMPVVLRNQVGRIAAVLCIKWLYLLQYSAPSRVVSANHRQPMAQLSCKCIRVRITVC